MHRVLKLRGFFILITVGIVMLAFTANTYLNVNEFIRLYKERTFDKIFLQVQHLQKLTEDIIQELDIQLREMDGINHECQNVVTNVQYSTYCYIIDKEGTVRHHSDLNEVGNVYTDPTTMTVLASLEKQVNIYELQNTGKTIYDFSLPIRKPTGERIGVIRLGVESEIIDKEVSRLITRATELGIGFIVFTCLAMLILFRYNVLNPIRHVLDGISKFGEGNFSTKIELKSENEIGQIAESFNSMSEKILKYMEERDKAEANLKESEKRFKDVALSTADMLWEVDEFGVCTYCSEKIEELLGYTREEIVGKSPLEILVIEDIEKVRDFFKRTFKSREPIKDLELWIRTKDGHRICLLMSGVPITDANGNRKGFRGVNKNITEKKRSEEALRKSEENYHALFEESKDAVFISTPDGELIEINPAGIKMFGYESKSELLTLDVARDIFWDPKDREKYQQIINAQGYVKDYEIELRAKNNRKLTVLETANVVRDNHNSIIAYRGIMRDITSQKQLEAQILQAQKMESVGLLAGGIAHDFNNLLTPILGYSELLIANLEPTDARYRSLRQIIKAAERAKELTRQLLPFSKSQMPELKTIYLGDVLKHFEDILRRTIREDILIEMNISSDLHVIRADVAQIEQVIMNLAVNAQDAMLEEGTLTINVRNVIIDETYSNEHPDTAVGSYVMLEVSDTGCGIDEVSREHLFEPFYTTKEKGKGTGLGLSTVYGIVKQHGGSINLNSEQRKGSTFQIFFPSFFEEGNKLSHDVPLMPEPVKGTETILVVDDDEMVRGLVCEMLRNLGYNVLEAESGTQCIDIVDKYQGAIDMLLTDVIMPNMDGKKIYNRLRMIKSGLKVLYMSGHISNILSRHEVLDEGVLLVQKPFSVYTLSKKIREVLDS